MISNSNSIIMIKTINFDIIIIDIIEVDMIVVVVISLLHRSIWMLVHLKQLQDAVIVKIYFDFDCNTDKTITSYDVDAIITKTINLVMMIIEVVDIDVSVVATGNFTAITINMTVVDAIAV